MFNKHLFNTAQFNEEPVVTKTQVGGAIVAPSSIIRKYMEIKLRDTVIPTAAIIKETARYAGMAVLTPSGFLQRKTRLISKAVITSIGRIRKKSTVIFDGTVASTAVIAKNTGKSAGSADCIPNATLKKIASFRLFAGNANIVPLSLLKKAANKKIVGICSYIANILKYSTRRISSEVIPAGILSDRFDLEIPTGGVIAPAGELTSILTRGYQKPVGGAVIIPNSMLSKTTGKTMRDTVNPIGNVLRVWRIKVGNAGLTPIRALSKATIIITGRSVIRPSAVFDKFAIKKTGSAVIAPASTVTKKLWFNIEEAITPIGNTVKKVYSSVGGVISSIGNAKTKYNNEEPPDEEEMWRLKLSRFLHALKEWR